MGDKELKNMYAITCFNPCIDRRHIQALDGQHVVMTAKTDTVNDMNGIKDDHLKDNNVCQVHRSVAFHNLHRYNNQHENLYPLIQHAPFHRYLLRV